MTVSAKAKLWKQDPASRHSSLVDALFTSTQQSVLSFLFGQPGRSFYVTQIMALAKSGRGAVQRELSRLSESGLVTVKNVGTQKHYQANPDSPLFAELCSIIRKTVGLEEPLRAAVASLPGKIKLALIYGSVAKRADTSTSDIDLLIVANSLTLEEIYSTLAPVEELIERRVNPTLYTSQEYDQRRKNKNAFLMRVLDGPTILIKGSIDAA